MFKNIISTLQELIRNPKIMKNTENTETQGLFQNEYNQMQKTN